jgi:NADH-quinone oxidoreductase subunit F
MLGRTFCALGDAAAMPTISIVDKFAADFEQHIERTTVALGQAVMV